MQLSGLSTDFVSKPIWGDPPVRPANLVSANPPTEVDIAIIGGGFTGLSAARIIAQQKISVAVLEAQTIGWGASSRSGGIATPGCRQSMQIVFKRYGETLANEFWNASMDAIDLLGEIVADENIVCHFQRKGHILLAAKPSHFKKLRKKANWYKIRLNHALRPVSPAELNGEIRANVFHGGLVDEWSASLNPVKFLFGLAHAVRRNRGLICENTAVTRIEKSNSRYLLHYQHGTVRADKVIIATNGYTGELLPKLKQRVIPNASYVITTEPLPPSLYNRINPNGRSFFDSLRHPHYFRLLENGRLLFGGYPELTPNLSLKVSTERLYSRLTQIFPDLKGIPITHAWSGQIGSSTDLMPHIGEIDGIYYALGYSGNGVSMATYLGAEVGKLLTEQITRSPFLDIDHPRPIFYKKYPWYWSLKAKYDRLMDKLT